MYACVFYTPVLVAVKATNKCRKTVSWLKSHELKLVELECVMAESLESINVQCCNGQCSML